MQDLMTFLSHHSMLSFTILVVFILIIFIEYLRTRRHAFHISPTRSIQFINRENAVVLDLRPQDSYRKGHIIEAISMTAKEIKENPKKLIKFQTRPLIIVDESGNEAPKVATMLLKQGYNAYSLAGGIRAWNEAQLPLIKE